MRLGPLPMPPAAITPAAAVAERANLLRTLAVASAVPLSALEPGPPTPAPTFVPPALPVALSTTTTLQPQPTRLPQLATPAPDPEALLRSLGSLPASPAAGTAAAPALLAATALPLSPVVLAAAAMAPVPLPAALTRMMVNAGAGDRLSLSAAGGSLRGDLSALSDKPAGRLALNLLDALTGEPRSRIQLLSTELPLSDAPDYAPRLLSARPEDLLRVLVQGSLRGKDGKQIDLSLGLTLQRAAGAAVPANPAIQDALERLAQVPIQFNYPDAVAPLDGQRAQFQAVLDPQGLWPLQSFLMSGLLTLGRLRDGKALDEPWPPPARDDDEDLADQRESQDQRRREQPPQPSVDPQNPLPADGGVPIITLQRWLELELRHVRVQLRQWMALPPRLDQTL